MKEVTGALIIEAKEATFKAVNDAIVSFIDTIKEESCTYTDEEKEIPEGKINLLWMVVDYIQTLHQSDIERVKDIYLCSDTSTSYGAALRNWNSTLGS